MSKKMKLKPREPYYGPYETLTFVDGSMLLEQKPTRKVIVEYLPRLQHHFFYAAGGRRIMSSKEVITMYRLMDDQQDLTSFFEALPRP